MPLTQLDKKVALIVIDLQKGVTALPLAQPVAGIIAKSAELARAFRRRGLPVVLVNVVAATPGRTDAGPRKFVLPEDWTELVPELQQESTDVLISKSCVSAFVGTALHEELQSRGVTQVFLTGIATSSGVDSTARTARDLGYHVVFVTDAMTDRDAEAHRFCVEKGFPKMGETETAEGVMRVLAG